MSIETLKKVLEHSVRDTFENGTVIRWKVDGGREVYLYAAIKSPVGWFTTASTGNRYVGQVMNFHDLVETLMEGGVTEVEVATEWEKVS